MFKAISDSKMGARFRLINIDKVTGEVTKDSDWFSNIILNAAKDVMPIGYATMPTPILGTSIIDEEVEQSGVLSPINNMPCTATKVLWGAKYVKNSDTDANVSWGQRFTFTNNNATSVEIGEIGIPNFNRAVFRNDAGSSYIWNVSPSESLLVEMDFNIRLVTPTGDITINVFDQDDIVLKTIKVRMRVCDKLEEAQVPEWWKVLSEPEHGAYYTTDTNFNGTVRPTAGTLKPVSIKSDYTYNGRTIDVAISHRGVTGGESIKGLVFPFGCLSPVITAVFVDPLYVGGGYTLDAGLTVTW